MKIYYHHLKFQERNIQSDSLWPLVNSTTLCSYRQHYKLHKSLAFLSGSLYYKHSYAESYNPRHRKPQQAAISLL